MNRTLSTRIINCNDYFRSDLPEKVENKCENNNNPILKKSAIRGIVQISQPQHARSLQARFLVPPAGLVGQIFGSAKIIRLKTIFYWVFHFIQIFYIISYKFSDSYIISYKFSTVSLKESEVASSNIPYLVKKIVSISQSFLLHTHQFEKFISSAILFTFMLKSLKHHIILFI